MDNKGYLINSANTSLVKSNQFVVATQAVRLYASGLSGSGDIMTIKVWVGDPVNGAFVPLFRGGSAVALTGTNNEHMETLTGRYQVVYAGGSSPVACYFETDDLNLDNKLFYSFSVGSGA